MGSFLEFDWKHHGSIIHRQMMKMELNTFLEKSILPCPKSILLLKANATFKTFKACIQTLFSSLLGTAVP